MATNPLISVIVPIYKVEEFLRPCIDSILEQTYRNLEIILVNDGSPDRCGIICDDYVKIDSRIVVIHKENGGLSDARNVGLDICKGEYISFVDSDDIIHPQFIEVLYQNLVEHKADISFCDFFRFKNVKDVKTSTVGALNTEILDSDLMINYLYNNIWYPKNVVVWNKLYKSTIFSKLRFEKGFLHEDELMFTDLYIKNYKLAYADIDLIFYRERTDSIMSSNFSINKIESRKRIFEKRNTYFKHQKRDDFLVLNRKIWLVYLGFWILNDKSKKNKYFNLKEWFSMMFYKEFHWKSKILLTLKFLNVN